MEFITKGEQAALKQLMTKLADSYVMMDEITNDPSYLVSLQEDILKTQQAVLDLQKKILAKQREILKSQGAE